jgi:NADPH:quinone reductase-like Zn-dependent oxidoreductase
LTAYDPGTGRTPAYETLGGAHPGVLSEYVVLPEGWFVAAPKSLDAAEASTLPCAGLTAWFALVEKGHLRAGDRVVVQGTGGVALFGLQIAKATGAEVIVTSSSREKLDRAFALGADHGINRLEEDWVERVYALTGDRGADHILEIAGGAGLGQSLKAVAPDGAHLGDRRARGLRGLRPGRAASPEVSRRAGYQRRSPQSARRSGRGRRPPWTEARHRHALQVHRGPPRPSHILTAAPSARW